MKLADIIETYISGDWGEEIATTEASNAVFCVRGADFVPIANHKFKYIPQRYINNKSLESKGIKVGDLIIEKSGGSPTQSTGRIVYVSEDLIKDKNALVCSNFCVAFRVKSEWNPLYVYYYWQNIYNHGAFFNFEGKTSGIKNLQLDNALAAIDIEYISLEEQNNIVSSLSAIDIKMNLNRQINDNLEAMAKQLYDYWFVQFDFPNEEGKPYKSSGGAMVWNDKLKREIPQGWDFCFLEDLLTIRNGRDHKHLADGIYPVYGSGGEMRKVSEYLYDGESVLMPRKGSLNNIMYVNEAFWTVDTMFYSEMKLSNCAKYIYYTIKDIDFTRWNSGTGVPSMTSSTLYSIKLVKPQNETLKKFDEMISPLFEHMKQISEQNVVLTKQRDELLPLLMNGQASVNYHLYVFSRTHFILFLSPQKVQNYERS